jgi:hypothetical protein
MIRRYKPKKLIVEGDQDQRVIPQLIEANGIAWGETRETAIVYIESYGSDQFIDETVISTELYRVYLGNWSISCRKYSSSQHGFGLKASGRIALGLIG